MRSSSAARPLGATAFVERRAELAALRGLIEHVERGVGRLAVVEGEPGIGKTRLVDEAVTFLDGHGWHVARGNGEELARERPFGVVADAFRISPASSDPERARIGDLLDLRFHLVDSICDIVERDAARRPVLIVAEDLHWADASSLLTLHRLWNRIRPLQVLVIVTTRPFPRSPELGQLLEAFERTGALQLQLAVLSAGAVAQLTESAVGHRIGPLLREEMARAGGNPLFAIELIEALKSERCIRLDEGVAELERRVDPAPSLRLAILRRVGFLPKETLHVLTVASALGTSFSVHELAAVVARPAHELLSILVDATEAGVLAAAGDQIAFRHDLVRDAFYLDMSPAARSALHAEAGRALAAAGAPAQRVAAHLLRAAVPGDSQAVEWLRRAAREAAPSGPGAAVDLIERALELLGPHGPAREEVQGDLILPLVWSGRISEAEVRARDVLARTSDVRLAAQTYHGLASALYLHQRMMPLAEMCEEALGLDDLPGQERAFFLGLSTIPLLALGRVDETLARADAALAAAENVGSPIAVFFATWAQGQVELLRGRYRQGAAMLQGLVEVAQHSATADGHAVGGLSLASLRIGLAHLLAAWGLLAADRAADAKASLTQARLLFEETGALPYISICQRSLASARFALGEWDDAVAESQGAWLLADETGVHGLRSYHGDPGPLIHLHRGDLASARNELTRIERALGPDAPVLANLWLLPQKGLVAAAGGDSDGALRAFEDVCELAARLELIPDYRVFGVAYVRIALANGRRDLARRAADAAAELARRAEGVASAEGAALLCRGLVDEDAETLGRAVAAYRRASSPLDLAVACEEAGIAHARRGERACAVSLLQEALEIVELLSAGYAGARVRQHLRALGVRRGARVARRRPAGGWDSVTATELKVVELVAMGLSNPEIGERLYVSRRTVRAHLESVFRKLDVSSRAELAAVAARRGLPAGR